MKQLYRNFVLPPLLISVAIVVLLVQHSGQKVTTFFVVFLLLVLNLICLQTARHLNQLRLNLKNIENGYLSNIDSKGNGVFAQLNRTLSSIFEKIRKQEDELQREKISRLRSVIDGQDQERNRLSRELHDGIGQSLIAVKLQLENAETQNYSLMRAGIDSAKGMIDLTIEDVRRVCNALLPAALNEFGIVSTLRALCSELASLAGFKATFENEGSLDRISKKSQVYLYRIAQETLNNIAKHARATQVIMKLKRENNIVTLLVTDNGKGFIFDPISFAQRNGLQNMRERTQLLQGEFTIKSEPGNGTTIKVSIPYNIGDGKNQIDTGG